MTIKPITPHGIDWPLCRAYDDPGKGRTLRFVNLGTLHMTGLRMYNMVKEPWVGWYLKSSLSDTFKERVQTIKCPKLFFADENITSFHLHYVPFNNFSHP